MTTLARPAPLLGTEARRAKGVGNELDRAAQLAEREFDDEGADDIQRAADDAGDWARGLRERLGGPCDRRPTSAREQGEISDRRRIGRR